ncbi:hypothetical protein LTR56_010877 [Elasticomyces elasticus]|nr:hypothetical protein LTR56_010877 [Elasticomyces elasticus]KAK3650250.1 hypothetical protein LTR22_012577 [Elasticomyces elasticus]KAK4911841.1 hypothetical protein LTR49_019641 [Elasticomyces elasticus]KAK5768269.1 hypothetical protein LTS12_001408 [Elasticomyces elasticus]
MSHEPRVINVNTSQHTALIEHSSQHKAKDTENNTHPTSPCHTSRCQPKPPHPSVAHHKTANDEAYVILPTTSSPRSTGLADSASGGQSPAKFAALSGYKRDAKPEEFKQRSDSTNEMRTEPKTFLAGLWDSAVKGK